MSSLIIPLCCAVLYFHCIRTCYCLVAMPSLSCDDRSPRSESINFGPGYPIGHGIDMGLLLPQGGGGGGILQTMILIKPNVLQVF